MIKKFFIAFTIVFLIILVESIASMADAVINQDRTKFIFLNGVLICNCFWLATIALFYLIVIRKEA